MFKHSLRKIDAFQQSRKHFSIFYAVTKKYGEDNGGKLTVQLTYSMFTTVFPLLLLLITILTLLLAGYPSIKADVLKSTFSEFPVVGSQLGQNIHVLRRDSIVALFVGLVGVLYGGFKLASSGLYVMEQVWQPEGHKKPNYLKRLERGITFLAVLGLGLIVTTLLSGFGTYSRHYLWLAGLTIVLAALANIGIYLASFRVLTPKSIASHALVPGAIFGGISWTILQALGGYIVGHYLKNDNATYGVFGTVLGLMAWLYLGAALTVFAAELNNVIKRRLWPRSMT